MCVCVCCLLQLFDLGGEEGGTNETDGTLIASQVETGYECERQHTYRSGECHNHDTVANRNVITYLSVTGVYITPSDDYTVPNLLIAISFRIL